MLVNKVTYKLLSTKVLSKKITATEWHCWRQY